MACETCWGDAYMRYLASGDDRSQYDHYLELLAERAGNPCDPAAQEAPAGPETGATR